MKRVPLTTAFASLLMVGAGGSFNKTFAHEAAASSTDKGKNPARVEFGVMPGSNRTHFVGDLMVPLFQNGIDRSFGTNIKLMTNTQSQREGNFGLYYGQIANDMLYRVYGFWDVRSQETLGQRNTFSQVTLGTDVTTKNFWQVRANVYIPITKKKELRRDVEPGSIGHEVGVISQFNRVYQRALYGADAEVGFRIPTPGVCNVDWRAYAGGFYFDASGSESVAGPRLRTEARIHNVITQGDWVRLGVQGEYATNRAYKKNQAPKDRFDVTFTVAYSVNLYSVFGYKTRLAAPKTLYAEMNSPIVRDIDVVVQADAKKKLDKPVMLAPAVDGDGNPIFATFVDNVNGKTIAEGGDGSSESPFIDSDDALNPATNKAGLVDNAIMVFRGNGTDNPYSTGGDTITPVADNMKFIGEGADYSHLVEDRSTGAQYNAVILKKAQITQLNHSGKNDLFIGSDKNFTIHGFDIAMSDEGRVVKSVNTTNVRQVFSSLNVTGTKDNAFAFDISNTAGTTTVAIDKVGISGFTQALNGGISLVSTLAGNITATISNSTITENADGVAIRNATGTSNVTISDSTITKNKGSGVQTFYDGAGKATLTFKNTSVSENTDSNVDIGALNGHGVQASADNSHFDGSGGIGFNANIQGTSTFSIKTSGNTTFNNNKNEGLHLAGKSGALSGAFTDTVFEGNEIGFEYDPEGMGSGTFVFGSGTKFINNTEIQLFFASSGGNAQATKVTFEKGSNLQHTAGSGIRIDTTNGQTTTLDISGLTAVGHAGGDFINHVGDAQYGGDALVLNFGAGNKVSGYKNIGFFEGGAGNGGTVITVTLDADNVFSAANGFDLTNAGGSNGSLATADNFSLNKNAGNLVTGNTAPLPTVMAGILQANRYKG